jgi:hypothetical protein
MLNVKYAVGVNQELYRNRSPEGVSAERFEELEIHESPVPVTPRAFLAHSVVGVSDFATARSALFPSESVIQDVIAQSVAEGFVGVRSFSAAGAIRARYERDRVEVALAPAAEPRFLVLNELFHPRWRAYSTRGELTVYPTNVVMRGVIIPAGVDHVSFEFVPLYRPATAVAAALLGLGILAVALRGRLSEPAPAAGSEISRT